jgi:DNA-directed RNA polymerase specialized sigma24 family protein
MSITKRDLLKKEKEYEELYPLDTKKGVLSLLFFIHEIGERRFYEADYEASDLLLDLEISISNSGLTYKQKEVIDLLYFKCLTQVEAAKLTGSTQQAILDRKNKALRKIILFNKKGN